MRKTKTAAWKLECGTEPDANGFPLEAATHNIGLALFKACKCADREIPVDQIIDPKVIDIDFILAVRTLEILLRIGEVSTRNQITQNLMIKTDTCSPALK